jgi:hypothetical protein
LALFVFPFPAEWCRSHLTDPTIVNFFFAGLPYATMTHTSSV